MRPDPNAAKPKGGQPCRIAQPQRRRRDRISLRPSSRSDLALVPRPSTAAPQSVEEIANYTGADRQQILEAGAKTEGALMVYATGTQIQPLIDRFEQKYPYIHVQLPRADSGDDRPQGL